MRLGQLVNQTELGRDVALTQATVHGCLNLLESSYLLVRLPAFAAKRTKRLIKAPKLHWGDTGVALHLAEMTEPSGAHLESLVLNDLRARRGARHDRAEIGYWPTASGAEVDLVIETGGYLLPIEIKATPVAGTVQHHAGPAQYRYSSTLNGPSIGSDRYSACAGVSRVKRPPKASTW